MNIVGIWPNMQIDHFATQKSQSEKASLVTMISLPFFVTISLFIEGNVCSISKRHVFTFSLYIFVAEKQCHHSLFVWPLENLCWKEVEKTTMEKGFELCKSTEKKENCDCESCNLCQIFFSVTFCLLTSTVSQFSLWSNKALSNTMFPSVFCYEVLLVLVVFKVKPHWPISIKVTTFQRHN